MLLTRRAKRGYLPSESVAILGDMATTGSIKVLKSFNYRGGARVWSNRYHFDGTVPPDSTHWTTLSDLVVLDEKVVLPDYVTIVQTLGYGAGSDVPVFTKTYSTAGTLSSSGAVRSPGDAAVMVRYSTSARTSKNHPLYLFNYYHGCLAASDTDPDTVASGLVARHDTYAGQWITGLSDGAVTHHRAGPNGDVATGHLTSTAVRHRDFPN